MRNKVVIVTGASSGIGLACATEFAANGATVVVAARNRSALESLCDKLSEKYGVKTLAIETDVTSEEECKNLIEQTFASFGRIDILVNNAGISMRAKFTEMKMGVLAKIMAVNFWGNVYCARYAVPHLLKTKGSLVSVSSISGFTALPGRTAYCASKYAIHGFMEALRIETLKTGLHVMIVAPGFTTSNIRKNALDGAGNAYGETPRNEEKMLSPEKVARLMIKGIRRKKRSLIISTLGWWTITVNKFIPWFVDRRVYTHMAKEDNAPFLE